MSLLDRSSLQDAAQYLDKEARRNDYFFKEMRLDWVWLCYCMMQYKDNETINKERQRIIEEQEQMSIVYEWTLNARGNRNRTPIMWKINLCKTKIGNYRDRAVEYWRKEKAETWYEPSWSIKEVLYS